MSLLGSSRRLVGGIKQLAFLLSISAGACASVADEETACAFGAYENGAEQVVLYQRFGEQQVRYTFVDGRRGVLNDGAPVLACIAGELRSASKDVFERVALDETDTAFRNDGLNLAGRLISRQDHVVETTPLVVFVHGSESTPTVGYSPYPYLLAMQGVSVFAYDKRGTGKSDGAYTQNFHALAADAVAASFEAKRLVQNQHSRFGLFGGSQGGWVAPLAAKSAGAEFLVVGFGLVLSPIEEDAEQVFDEMRRAGYSVEDIEKARDVTNATGEVIASHFTAGFEFLAETKRKYKDEPWFEMIEGEYTGAVLRASEADLRNREVEGFEDTGTSWRHDAVSVLKSLTIPQLWVIAAEDTAAPGMVTQERLQTLQEEGLPITIATFPDTDHGMVEFIEKPDGGHRYTRFTEGYFRLIADAMKDVNSPPYGRSVITCPQ